MQSKSCFEELRELIPADLVEGTGSVFYTGSEGWTSDSTFYVLGLNPGGNPKNVKESVDGHTEKVAAMDLP